MSNPLCECECGESVRLPTLRFVNGHQGRLQAKLGWSDYPPPVQDSETGCLRWQGPHHSGGYGKVGSKGYAHRIAYERANGPIPDGMVVDHVYERGCRYRDCVNDEHMEVVTAEENISRGEQSRRTHCPQGHEYSGKNLMVRKGKRECRSCTYARNERNRKARRAARLGA